LVISKGPGQRGATINVATDRGEIIAVGTT
jgi:hypothetical protein